MAKKKIEETEYRTTPPRTEHRREAKRRGHERRREESTGAENRTARRQADPNQVWTQTQSGHGRAGLPPAFLGGRRLVRTRARPILFGWSGKKTSPLSAWRGEPSTLVDSRTSSPIVAPMLVGPRIRLGLAANCLERQARKERSDYLSQPDHSF